MSPRGRAAEGTRAPSDPLRRYGWLAWGAWLVFLAFPLGESLGAGSRVAQVLGVVGTLVFGALYMAGVWLMLRDPGRGRQVGVLAALAVLAAMLVPALGLGAVSFLPYLVALGSFALPRPAAWWWSAAMFALLAFPWVLDPSPGWVVITFIVVAVAIGTGAGRLMADQGGEHARLSEALAVTAERDRVARDVHDVLGHSLTVVALKAQLAERLLETDPERARAELAAVSELARESLAEIRATVTGLRSTGLEDEVAAAGAALAAAGVAAALPEDCSVLDPRRRTVAAWALREAVTNVVRHAGASRCAVELGPASLHVVDDGAGIGSAPAGGGLRGLRERVEASGGSLDVAAVASGGTELRVQW